jgi:hypothetical protein
MTALRKDRIAELKPRFMISPSKSDTLRVITFARERHDREHRDEPNAHTRVPFISRGVVVHAVDAHQRLNAIATRRGSM